MKYALITTSENGLTLFDLDGESFDEACDSADDYENQGFPSIWIANKEDLLNINQKIQEKIKKMS